MGRATPPAVTKYAAFLRGMNVGGHRIRNADLCECFERLGFRSVSAFLASGNVVFESPATATTTTQAITRRINSGLGEQLGYEVPTFLRSATQVRTIATRDPFAAREGGTPRGKQQIAFLGAVPSAAAIAAALRHSSDDDWLHIQGRELYWHPVGKLSESALDFKAIRRALGQMTVRTTNTVNRLASKYFE